MVIPMAAMPGPKSAAAPTVAKPVLRAETLVWNPTRAPVASPKPAAKPARMPHKEAWRPSARAPRASGSQPWLPNKPSPPKAKNTTLLYDAGKCIISVLFPSPFQKKKKKNTLMTEFKNISSQRRHSRRAGEKASGFYPTAPSGEGAQGGDRPAGSGRVPADIQRAAPGEAGDAGRARC